MARTNASTRKDEMIISALLCNPTLKAASEVCGISETQIRQRLKEPDFKKMYDNARHDVLWISTNALQCYLSKAVETIVNVMEKDDANNQVKLNAAELIMRYVLKFTEDIDILDRLDALENDIL